MHIDYLIQMANDIGTFFASEPEAQAAAAIHNHLTRFWDPRMRAQIVAHYHESRGEGMEGAVLNAVKQLAAEHSKQVAS